MRNIYRTYREHYKALFFLGLPIVIGQIGVIVLGFADTLMIGHHSTVELGAASFVNNVFNLAIIFSTGFSYGLTPVVGGLYGTHQFAPAGQALRNSLLANLMVALLLTLCMTVLYLNIENLGQPEELIPLIKPFIIWCCWLHWSSLCCSMVSSSLRMESRIPRPLCGYFGRKCIEYHRKLSFDLRKVRFARVGIVGSRYQHIVFTYYDGARVYHYLLA